jgi:glycosyltransferase 2 family protein
LPETHVTLLARAERLWLAVRAWSSRRWLRRLVALAVVGLSGGVLAWMLLASWPDLAATRGQWRAWPIAAAAAVYALDLLLAVWAWSRLLRTLAPPLAYRQHFRIYGLTLVAGRIPGAPWHLLGRTVLYGQQGLSRRVTALAAGIELVIIVVSGFIVGQLVGYVLPERAWPVLALAVLVAVLLLLHPGLLRRLVTWAARGEPAQVLRHRDVLGLLAAYCLVWLVGGAMLYLVILAIYPLPVAALPGVIGAWGLSGSLAVMAIFSPSGLGIREITLTALLALYVPLGVAVAAAIATRILLTGLELAAAGAASRL